MNLLIDKKYRKTRIWSNKELKKFAHIFQGNVVNVSGWKDIDKEGRHYKDYFKNARSYSVSNYKSEFRGFQGRNGETFLDLNKNLEKKFINKYDVAFNHTTLEHIYNFKKAFSNLCLMSRDIVIIVVPFLQPMHIADYGDYWRFTPLAIKKLFEENGLKLLYLNFNNHKHTSVYIFAIGSKNPKKWKNKIKYKYDIKCKRDFLDLSENYAGCRAITNNIIYKVKIIFSILISKLLKKIK